VVQAISKNKTTFAFSNIAEYETTFELDDPVSIEITCVSVIEDQYIQIDVVTDDFPKPFQQLYLLRDFSKTPIWSIDSLQLIPVDSADFSPKNQYRFTDNTADPHSGLYYYQLVAKHFCKRSDESNLLSSIYLDGKRTEKYQDSVYFFRVGIPNIDLSEQYALYRIVNNDEKWITSGLTVANNSYNVDVEDFMVDGAAMKYLVKSNKGCYSNSKIIEHEPSVKFPNAFYPLSGRAEDITFYPIINFPSDDSYLFIIYNRWGEEIYRSTLPPVNNEYLNPQGRWDGTFQGKACPTGIYVYTISYKYNGGVGKFSDRGSFMLVR
jgi:hypothetical protein